MSAPAIEVASLRKSYGGIEAVRGIDLEVKSAEVFALLGPNGAGKTTTVEILEGHRQRDSGEVSVLGFDPSGGERAYKQRIGIVLQETGVERYLTVEEAIELYRGYYPRPLPLDEVIEVVGLSEKRAERVGRLSGGQRRRLDVAVGLAGNPDLLFLDEPTTGFDPSARRNAWQMVKNLKALGKTIFLTTHYMDEAQNLADRVAVIVGGQIVAEGPPSSLAGRDGGRTKISFSLPPGASPIPPEVVAGFSIDGGVVHGETKDPVEALNRITSWALSNDVALEGLQVAQPTLEDVFLELTEAEQAPPPEGDNGKESRRRRR